MEAIGSEANLAIPSVKVCGAVAVAALGTAEGAAIKGDAEAAGKLDIPAFAESGRA
jgi:hypothetical protein